MVPGVDETIKLAPVIKELGPIVIGFFLLLLFGMSVIMFFLWKFGDKTESICATGTATKLLVEQTKKLLEDSTTATIVFREGEKERNLKTFYIGESTGRDIVKLALEIDHTSNLHTQDMKILSGYVQVMSSQQGESNIHLKNIFEFFMRKEREGMAAGEEQPIKVDVQEAKESVQKEQAKIIPDKSSQ